LEKYKYKTDGAGAMKIKIVILSLLVAVFLFLTGCAEKSAGTGEKDMAPQGISQLSPAEQEKQSFEIFKEILELSSGMDRQSNLPQMKELYREIIDTYPESGLAQESYLRLIMIAREEKTAEGDAEAERLYQEFLGKYPDSGMRRILEYEARVEKP
jgi:hypothetical protein